jgi:hypothetical protein
VFDLDDHLIDLEKLSQADWDAALPSVSSVPGGQSLTLPQRQRCSSLLVESGIKSVEIDHYEDGRPRIASITFGRDLAEIVVSAILQRRSARVVRRVACAPVLRRRRLPRGRRTHTRRARAPGRSRDDPDLPLAGPLRGGLCPAAGGRVVRPGFEHHGMSRRTPSSGRIVTKVAGGSA